MCYMFENSQLTNYILKCYKQGYKELEHVLKYPNVSKQHPVSIHYPAKISARVVSTSPWTESFPALNFFVCPGIFKLHIFNWNIQF